jgi:hypothetical protein
MRPGPASCHRQRQTRPTTPQRRRPGQSGACSRRARVRLLAEPAQLRAPWGSPEPAAAARGYRHGAKPSPRSTSSRRLREFCTYTVQKSVPAGSPTEPFSSYAPYRCKTLIQAASTVGATRVLHLRAGARRCTGPGALRCTGPGALRRASPLYRMAAPGRCSGRRPPDTPPAERRFPCTRAPPCRRLHRNRHYATVRVHSTAPPGASVQKPAPNDASRPFATAPVRECTETVAPPGRRGAAAPRRRGHPPAPGASTPATGGPAGLRRRADGLGGGGGLVVAGPAAELPAARRVSRGRRRPAGVGGRGRQPQARWRLGPRSDQLCRPAAGSAGWLQPGTAGHPYA